MELSDLLSPSAVIGSLKVASKKQTLQALAARAATVCAIEERAIFDVLLERERLGSTGVGNGIAIPHGRLDALNGIVGVFARLARPVDFDAVDGAPVDLVFTLLAPEGAGADHLKALARVARILRDPQRAQTLRMTSDPTALYALLATPAAASAA